jgi:hypothetical protein
MPSEPDRFRLFFAQFLYLYSQSLAIAGGIARTWRAMRTVLAKGQIVPQNLDAGLLEGVRHSDQWRGVAVGSCAVGEKEASRQNEAKMRKGRPARQPFD